jgi:hypothetical protein
LVKGAIFFEEKRIKLPQRATSPNEQRNFLKDQGRFSSRREKQNGSTNHVPLNNNFLGEKGINFF